MSKSKITEANTKILRLMEEKGLTPYSLNQLMVIAGYPKVNVKTLRMICKGQKQLYCTLSKRRAFPSLLERLCIVLETTSDKIIEF